jgi:uncharacterized protein YgiM (DUF1202 family)
MKTRLFCVIIICVLSISTIVHGATLQSGIIKGDSVNLRIGPGYDSDIICELQLGSAVDIIEQGADWIKVQLLDGQTGWINQQFVEVKSATSVADRERPTVLPMSEILNYAQSLIGISYVYGGASIRGFDCSGFTMYVMAKFGVNLPHEADLQMESGAEVQDRKDLIPGDLVFFKTMGSQKVNHVGIYLGDNCFIHAASGYGAVRISPLDSGYYYQRYVGGRRLQIVQGPNAAG